MGSSNDLVSEGTRRMIVNGVYWCLEIPIPESGTKVDLIGDYKPSMFGFESDEYWAQKGLRVSDFE